jgi:hypothetical protein
MSCHNQLPTYFISSTKKVERQVRKNREGEGDERIRSRDEEGGRKEGRGVSTYQGRMWVLPETASMGMRACAQLN